MVMVISIAPSFTQQNRNLYHDGWIDLNKNGEKDVYEDPFQPVEKRVRDLLSQMTPEDNVN